MKLVVHKTQVLKGKVTVPGSKSHSVRGLLLATLAKGKSTLSNIVKSEDSAAAMEVCRALGATVTVVEEHLEANGLDVEVESQGLPLKPANEVFSGNSGITTRFMLPILGLREGAERAIKVDVDEQMRARPMSPLLEALSQLGMRVEGELFPLDVSGELRGGEVMVDGTTSQYLSALLLALPCAPEDSLIRVKNLNERPYVDMTLAWLDQQEIKTTHTREGDMDLYAIPGGQSYAPIQKAIPGDFSSASYLIAAGVLWPGDVQISGLDRSDEQGDKAFIEVLTDMGADLSWEEGKLLARGGSTLKGREIDCNAFPDLLPTLAVVATQAEGETRLTKVAQARIKETDRIHSMAEGLAALGADIRVEEDDLVIRGGSPLRGSSVRGYGDHRTIMALALAGMLAEGETTIDTAEGIKKTFPHFVDCMRPLGAKMNVQPERLIVMGFKHVGKTSFGKHLTQALNWSFIDLDDVMESLFFESHGVHASAREIVHSHGESFLRALETSALQQVLEKEDRAVIALGGGTPMAPENQALLGKEHCLHLTADPDQVFQWIQDGGPSPLFDAEDPRGSFDALWAKRLPVYEKLATHTLFNHNDYERMVGEVLKKLGVDRNEVS